MGPPEFPPAIEPTGNGVGCDGFQLAFGFGGIGQKTDAGAGTAKRHRDHQTQSSCELVEKKVRMRTG